MKRYLSISLTLFLYSAVNALTYMLLGILYGNEVFSEIFTLTYPLQFVCAIILSFFCIGSNIRANKENNKDCVSTGMILGVIFGLVVFTLITVFIDNYIVFMNFDPNVFHFFAIMSVGQLFFSFVISVVAEKLYFENKDKTANICKLGFIILNFATVIFTTLLTHNQITIVCVNLCCLAVYSLVYFILHIKKFHFDFSIFKNFKYESLVIFDQLFMIIIYLFGLSRVSDFGFEYIAALNLVTLITDPSWDALDAINKIAKIDISQSKYNYKKALKNSGIITAGYIVCSAILFFALFQTYHLNLTIGLIYLSIELLSMIIYIFKANLQTFFQLQYSPVISTSVNIIYKSVRTILSLCIISPYNISIGLVVGISVSLILLLIFRFSKFRGDPSGNLIRKTAGKDT